MQSNDKYKLELLVADSKVWNNLSGSNQMIKKNYKFLIGK